MRRLLRQWSTSSFAVGFWGVFFLAFAALLFRGSFYPVYFDGEEAHAVRHAEALLSSLEADPRAFPFGAAISEYNKGYAWFLILPLHLGYAGESCVRVLFPIFACIAIAAYLRLIAGRVPPSQLLLCACWCVGLALLALAVRRYKWHTLSYYSCLAIYLIALARCSAETGAVRKTYLLCGLTSLAVSIFFYFGNIIFLPLAAAVFLYQKIDYRASGRWLFLGGGAALIAVAALTLGSDRWSERIAVSLEGVLDGISMENLGPKVASIGTFFGYLGWELSLMFALGVVVLVRRCVQRDVIAWVTLGVFVYAAGLQWLIEGLDNPDWLNWLMMPLLGIIYAAVSFVYEKLRPLRGGLILFIVLTGVVGFRQILFFPTLHRIARHQWQASPENTTTQLAALLRHLHAHGDSLGTVLLPSIDLAPDRGGFDAAVLQLDSHFAQIFATLPKFESIAELPPGTDSRPVRLYFNASGPDDAMVKSLEAAGFAREWIPLFTREYDGPIVVTEFRRE